MKLSLDLRATLSQTLTPQQIQYLKLLQLPLVQLEQQLRTEVEQNPMLEEAGFEDSTMIGEDKDVYEGEDYHEHPVEAEESYFESPVDTFSPEYVAKPAVDDTGDPFEFYRLVWQDDSDYLKHGKGNVADDEDGDFFQIKDTTSFIEEILQQFRLLPLTDEELLIGEQIIWNVDSDGYLRRDLYEIYEEINKLIADVNFEAKIRHEEQKRNKEQKSCPKNPAREFAISTEALALMNKNHNHTDVIADDDEFYEEDDSPELEIKTFSPVNFEHTEKVLKLIQSLEPTGFASRSVQECLIAQCKAINEDTPVQKLALEILEKCYDAFTMKHYHVIQKQLSISENELRLALDMIKRLNPKPGGGDTPAGSHTIIPDFVIERDEESGEPIITVNDSRLPSLKLSNAYEKLKREAKFKVFNKDTKEWLRNKYEDAKFIIQAIRQRKNTMLKVMTSIAGSQRDFFDLGPAGLKPMIYKNVAEDTGLDISTVCRIVNGKYVQTEFGIFELKYFFSESLPSEDGEDVSTRVIKQVLKDICDSEPKGKPYSDEKIAKELKKRGYNVARRTVAKYREQLKIPVARLRREL